MTAEERMAYFQGERRRTSMQSTSAKENKRLLFYLKMKFFAAVIIFIIFLSLDYTGYKIQGIGSEDIIKEVTRDLEIPINITSTL